MKTESKPGCLAYIITMILFAGGATGVVVIMYIWVRYVLLLLEAVDVWLF